MTLAVFVRDVGHGSSDGVGRSDRGLDAHHQDRIVAGVRQQHLKCRLITRGIGIADDIDGI